MDRPGRDGVARAGARVSTITGAAALEQWIADRDLPTKSTRQLLESLCCGLARPGARKRVKLKDLQESFFKNVPEAAHTAQRARRLAELVDELVRADAVRVPSSKRLWSRHTDPPLPNWIEVLWSAPAPTSTDAPVVWLPMLAFGARERHPGRCETLKLINRYFSENPPGRLAAVPVKERSLMIFGDEKRLDALLDKEGGRTLFGGHLRLDELRCYRVPTPITVSAPMDPPPGLPLIVVENKDTWDSVARWNKDAGCFAGVAYGGGNAFEAGHEGLDVERERLRAGDLLYFGDIDASGMALPLRVNKMRANAGLPELLPASGAYRWLLEHGRRAAAQRQTPPCSDALCAWLDEPLAGEVMAMIGDGERIAQEWLSLDVLNTQANPLRC